MRNVVIIALDTLRADRLGAWGYPRPTSPNLDALASRSVVFEQTQAQSSQTAPSHASLFTGVYGGSHGIVNVHGASPSMPQLPALAVTFAELAKSAGYRTVAFVSGGNLTRGMGMNRGFELWDERNEDISDRITALLGWLERNAAQPGFVALLHSYQVHAPYVPPRELGEAFVDPDYSGPLRDTYERYLGLRPEEAFRLGAGPDYWPPGMVDYTDEDVRFLSDLYDAEIAYTDAQVRRVLQAVLSGPLAENTAIIVLSDHGEEFREHGKFQHDQLYEELVHVPLIVKLPNRLEREGWRGRVSTPVELLDLAPTLAELLGVDASRAPWAGRSLVRLMDPGTRSQEEAAEERPRFSLLVRDPGPQTFASVTWRGWKYLRWEQPSLNARWEKLFDLRSDPGEQRNLFESREGEAPVMRERLVRALRDHEARERQVSSVIGEAGEGELDAAQREELMRLGYFGSEQDSH